MRLSTAQLNNQYRGFNPPIIEREMIGKVSDNDLIFEAANLRFFKTDSFYFVINNRGQKTMLFLENLVLVCKGDLKLNKKVSEMIYLFEAGIDRIKSITLPKATIKKFIEEDQEEEENSIITFFKKFDYLNK